MIRRHGLKRTTPSVTSFLPVLRKTGQLDSPWTLASLASDDKFVFRSTTGELSSVHLEGHRCSTLCGSKPQT